MTLEELKLIPMQYVFGYSADTHALRQYINEEHGFAKQTITTRNKRGVWGKGQSTFKLLKTGEEFDTIDGLLAAINKEKT